MDPCWPVDDAVGRSLEVSVYHRLGRRHDGEADCRLDDRSLGNADRFDPAAAVVGLDTIDRTLDLVRRDVLRWGRNN